jgi:hypothetical protein
MTNQRGQTTVELALALPVVLFVLAALVEIGFIAGDQVRLWHAAREAARVSVVDPSTSAALKAAEEAGFESLELVLTPQRAYRRQGEPLTAELTYDRPGLVPLVGALFEGIKLTSRATMRIELP